MAKAPSLFTARVREELRQRFQQRASVVVPVRRSRNAPIDPALLEECRLEAEQMNFPPLMRVEDAAVRVALYDPLPQVGKNLIKLFNRTGLGERLLDRGGAVLVRPGDVIYALRVETRRHKK